MIEPKGKRYCLHEAIKYLLDAALETSPQAARDLVVGARIMCAGHDVSIDKVARPYGVTKTRVAITIILDAIDRLEQGEPSMDIVDNVIAWEQGDLNQEETVSFFQELIDSGLAWTLQGCYGRQAMALIKSGLCHPKEESQEGTE